MKADLQQIKRALKSGNLERLFIEDLGWDKLREAPPKIPYGSEQYTFDPLAKKAEFKIYQLIFNGRIPEKSFLYKLDKVLNDYATEHLTVFLDSSRENQVWLWVRRDYQNEKQRLKRRVLTFNKQQSGELLAQKLEILFVSLEEEEQESLTLTTILDRVRQAFDVEKVVRKFYTIFEKKHEYFLKNIENIPDDDEHKNDRRWYTSIMLNRLMFVYFIQKKGLLDNDSAVRLEGKKDYLRIRLAMVQEKFGRDKFYAFYRHFLLRLFHEGLSRPEEEHSPELKELIGKVPHINGGLFDVHELEARYPDIRIKDEVFEQIFEFFEGFDWHLDDRPMRSGDEINPDVLGYIFEKYINQKQMGAYYTKEDITGYISKNTIIPFIFEKVATLHPDAFAPDGPIWSPLKENPEEYIYDAISYGVLEPLPSQIEAGCTDVTQRASWNQPADEQYALPTETWREVAERRRRYEEIYSTMRNGEICTINNLITYNLNITQFAQDVIASCENPGLLRAFYDTIKQVTVLDPTCGSGAFLFAALNILKPLYESCIQRMRVLVAQYKAQGKESNHIQRFQQLLDGMESHQSQDYIILKSIIIHNLYGVDIMEEAVEICKLRLFLKLVAKIDKPNQLEPLPDIDFNILAGNTLIGFTSMDEVRRVVTTKLLNVDDAEETLLLIERDAQEIERAEQSFRDMQTRVELDSAAISAYKQLLREKLDDLRKKLDPYLATEYGIYEKRYADKAAYNQAYAQWKRSHKPFHWWAEFYKIMHSGGFDVVIGNPPYVEYGEVKKQYKLKNYRTEECGNLYAFSVERMRSLLGKERRFGVIIPVASVCTDGYTTLQKILTETGSSLIVSNYNDRPSKLFEGLEHIRLSIILYQKSEEKKAPIFTTKYNKWSKEEREKLFEKLIYGEMRSFIKDGSVPKIHDEVEKSILQKILKQKRTLSFYARKRSNNLIYYTRKLSGFVQVLECVPLMYDDQGQKREPSELKSIAFETVEVRNAFLSILNSNLFYWFLTIYSDCRNLNKREIYTINFDFEQATHETIHALSYLSSQLMKDLEYHSKLLEMKYKQLGNLRIQCFYPKYSKPIIDEIDRVLAQHYGFTAEELDFIINYDIKYRMGRDSGEESEE